MNRPGIPSTLMAFGLVLISSATETIRRELEAERRKCEQLTSELASGLSSNRKMTTTAEAEMKKMRHRIASVDSNERELRATIEKEREAYNGLAKVRR